MILVALEWRRDDDPRTGLGVASIAATLRAEAGVEADIVTTFVNDPSFDAAAFESAVVAAAGRAGPEAVVALGVYVWNEAVVQRLLPSLRARWAGTIVLGGPQVTYAPPGTLETSYPHADVFIRGHAEVGMVALARRDPRSGAGLHLAGTPDVGHMARMDPGRTPSPYLDGTLPIGRHVRWETQRGCPFVCNFCQHPGAVGRSVYFPIERVLAELDAFAGARVERISVLDPIFNTDTGRAVRILEHARSRRLRAKLVLQCRFEYIDGAFLDALEGLDATLEFGLQTIHDAEGRAVRRPNKLDVVERVMRALRARGIDFEVSLIYGLPEQTLASFRETVAWCEEREVPRIRAWPLMLLRGTALYERRHELGLSESTHLPIPIVVASRSFTREDHARMEELATALLAPSRRSTAA